MNGPEISLNYVFHFLPDSDLFYGEKEKFSKVIYDDYLKIENFKSAHRMKLVLVDSHSLIPFILGKGGCGRLVRRRTVFGIN